MLSWPLWLLTLLYAHAHLPTLTDPETFASPQPLQIVLLNSMPIVWLALVIRLFTARPLFSAAIALGLSGLLHALNQTKLKLLAQPLLIADFSQWRQWLDHGSVLLNYTAQLKATAFALAGLFLILWLAWFLDRRLGYKRPGMIAVSLAMVLTLVPAFITGELEALYRLPTGSPAWEPAAEIQRYGLVRRLVTNLLKAGQLPTRPEEKKVNQLLAQAPSPHRQAKLPPVKNLVVILSESDFDPSILTGVEPGQYDTPAFQDIMQHSLHALVDVPTYGGLTLQSEYELLTGVSLKLLETHRYPFFTITHKPVSSLAYDLIGLGFQTTAIHPNNASFWNRNHAYPNLGFQKFIDITAFNAKPERGFYPPDRALMQQVLQQVKGSSKQFVYAVSVENHGPWKKERPGHRPEDLSAIEAPSVLNPNEQLAWKQYMDTRQSVQRAVVELLQQLQRRQERTLVLYFGDHLPALHSIFRKIGFDDGRPAWKQPTWFFLFDTHRDLGESTWPKPARSVYQLPELGTLLLDAAGEPLPDFHRVVSWLRGYHGQAPAQAEQHWRNMQAWRFFQPPDNASFKEKPEFCPITAWGPRKTRVGQPFNPQPDGRSAWWLKSECAPEGVRWLVDGQPVETVVRLPVITAALQADELLDQPGEHRLELADPDTGAVQFIGTFTVLDNKP